MDLASAPENDSAAVVAPQPGDVRWTRVAGSTGWDTAYATATDGANLWVAGTFQGTVNFGCGAMSATGATDMFLVKYTYAGACAWARSVGGEGAHEALALARDGYGNLYVSGGFSGTAVFPTATLAGIGEHDGFLAKYTSAGKNLWVQRLASTGALYAGGVAANAGGDVVVAGGFGGAAYLGGGELVASGEGDAFVARYTPIGGHVWSRRFGGAGYEEATDVALTSSNKVIVVGAFEGSMSAGGNQVMTSAGSFDAFVFQLAGTTGKPLASERFGSTGDDAAQGVAVDAAGNYVVGGYFQGSIDLGGGPLDAAGPYAGFVARYTGAGGYLWGRAAGGAGSWVFVSDVAVDATGEVFVTGDMTGAATFGGATLDGGDSDSDLFVADYSPAGRHQWSRAFGGVGLARGESVAAANTMVFVAGHIGDSVVVDDHVLYGRGGFDAAVIALRR